MILDLKVKLTTKDGDFDYAFGTHIIKKGKIKKYVKINLTEDKIIEIKEQITQQLAKLLTSIK